MSKPKLYYVHDRTRGFVGNSMVWWRKNHCGYTTNIDEAHEFTEEEFKQRCQADDLSAYPADEVRAVSELHVTRKHDLARFEIPLGLAEGAKRAEES